MATFGERLRQYRTSSEMTLEELAARLGTNKQVLSRYENGLRVPKITALQGYADKIGVNPLWLMGMENVSINQDTTPVMIDVTYYSPTKRAIIDKIGDITEDDARVISTLLGRISREDDSRGDQ